MLDASTPLHTDGAHSIFPQLKETMQHVQDEVRSRLVAMMTDAGGGAGANGHGGGGAAPEVERPKERPRTVAVAGGRRPNGRSL